jgi:hypothetical protein
MSKSGRFCDQKNLYGADGPRTVQVLRCAAHRALVERFASAPMSSPDSFRSLGMAGVLFCGMVLPSFNIDAIDSQASSPSLNLSETRSSERLRGRYERLDFVLKPDGLQRRQERYTSISGYPCWRTLPNTLACVPKINTYGQVRGHFYPG